MMVDSKDNNKDGESKELQARLQMKRFYRELKQRLRRHQPIDYALFASERLGESWGNLEKLRQTPPHRILHSIESSCAFHHPAYSDPVNWKRFAQIMNTYYNYENPYHSHVLDENVQRFSLILRREQIELQFFPELRYIARAWCVLGNHSILKKSTKEFTTKYSISPQRWIQLSFVAYNLALENKRGVIRTDCIRESPLFNSHKNEIDAFFHLSSISPDTIKNRYENHLKEIPYKHHALIRTAFLEKPFIDFGQGIMIAPHGGLVFRHAGINLYERFRECKDFAMEFSKSFENYVEEILREIKSDKMIYTEQDLKSHSSGKTCDFIISTDEVLLLVECKAVCFTANILSDNAIKNNNSTGKIAKGIMQLYETTKDLKENRFSELGIDSGKTTFGIVVTFGYIPAVNSDWYFSNFILNRTKGNLSESVYYDQKSKKRPIVVDIGTFEDIIRLLNSQEHSFEDLYKEKESIDYHAVGDWDRYISEKISTLDEEESLSVIDNAINQFNISVEEL